MTTIEPRPPKLRKLSPEETAQTPGLDAAASPARPAPGRRRDRAAAVGAFMDRAVQAAALGDPQPAAADSVRNTLGRDDRHEYDLLRVDWIRQSPRNPRKHFDQAGLEELAESIRQVGLLEPVVVRPAADSSSAAPRYELIMGERRWRAAQIAELTDLPAIIRRDVDDALQLRLALVENLQRQDLDPLEEAEGYRQLQELGMKQGEIAAAVHRSQPAIANAMRLLKLPPEVQDLICSGQLTVAHGLAILRFAEFPKVMAAIGKRAAKEGTPTRDLERQRLPWEWELADKGVVKRLPWDNPHKTTCNACPLKARKEEVCLLPSHWNELEEARKAAEREEAQRRAEEARQALAKLEEFRQWSAALPVATLLEAWRDRNQGAANLDDPARRGIVRAELAKRTSGDTVAAWFELLTDEQQMGVTGHRKIGQVTPFAELSKGAQAEVEHAYADIFGARSASTKPGKKRPEAAAADPLAHLPKYEYSKHINLHDRRPPTGCSSSCPCYVPQGRVTNYEGKTTDVVPMCMDAGRFQGLESADSRRKNKVNRARHTELLEELARQIDCLEALDESRTWAILFDVVCGQVGWKSQFRAAAERQDVALSLYGEYDPEDTSLYGFSGADVEKIARRPSIEIARLLIEAVVRENLALMQLNGQDVKYSDRAITWLRLDEIQVGDDIVLEGDATERVYRVEGYVTDRPTIASLVGKERAKETPRLVRLSYQSPPGVTTQVMIEGRCTTLAEYTALRKVSSSAPAPAESKRGPSFDPDAHLAEEIGAAQERLAAEYAAAQPQADVCQREGCRHSQSKHYDGNGGRGHESTGCKRGCGCTEFLADAPEAGLRLLQEVAS